MYVASDASADRFRIYRLLSVETTVLAYLILASGMCLSDVFALCSEIVHVAYMRAPYVYTLCSVSRWAQVSQCFDLYMQMTMNFA